MLSGDNPYGLKRDRRTRAELLGVIADKDDIIRDLSKKADTLAEDLKEEKGWRWAEKRELERDIEIVFAELDATRTVLFHTIQSISTPTMTYTREAER